jgi:hypothetical protein
VRCGEDRMTSTVEVWTFIDEGSISTLLERVGDRFC